MTVFIVDQEKRIADTCAEILRRNGVTALAFYDGQEALRAASKQPPHMVIYDVTASEIDNLAPDEIKRSFPACEVLLMSANAAVTPDDPETRVEILYKPIPPTLLIERVRAAQNTQRCRNSDAAQV